METNSHSTSRYILVVLCVAVVGTSLVLVALNALVKQPGSKLAFQSGASLTSCPAGDATTAYKNGYNAAREKLRASGLLTTPVSNNILSGTVVAVGTDTLTVKQNNLDTDPIADGIPDERIVTVAAGTPIYFDTIKTAFEMQRELAALKPGTPPPVASTRTMAKLSDIQVGQTVYVESKQDVRLLSSIPATQIVAHKS